MPHWTGLMTAVVLCFMLLAFVMRSHLSNIFTISRRPLPTAVTRADAGCPFMSW
ncbi:uncharacterized protein BO87DRAFT_379389 [Aspergillus neoniger CBS 115656]|uniref:Uncharacterized protein n=1 Tax=Aspergillus neoniger (strain CBS 115656) TaxID=1448310 RepID=A0A318YAE9_ASPNB|nr:hypothetical protein BO87DRAFT_379389 [Aspergillus neoniger CBS 115656]PYH30984.1 hypothetical protein BO87DRAFT_379389 [Aspergillus neoniger CBS 115656]